MRKRGEYEIKEVSSVITRIFGSDDVGHSELEKDKIYGEHNDGSSVSLI
jgi:hypothetical protein